MEAKQIKLDEIADGAASALFEKAATEVMENIYDPNTDAAKKRKITLEFIFTPGKNRDQSTVTVQAKTSLQPIVPVETIVLIGIEKNGHVVSNELKSGVIGQGYMDVETGEVKDDTGKPVVDDSKVLDLRQTK
ncbi:replication terminator protein [Listeria booriae]|uniref:Replication terminator protein n=1 Tax=Listeria booriae TaxID=1552123 RepID=A0A842G0T3_9LIST|nr:replication terminator protein [Listeria booriae]MBC2293729.1 replication terminator protein [Listeria booriae]